MILLSNDMFFNNQSFNILIDFIKSGGVGIIPTDTIYGLCCDAYNQNAIDKLFQIKQRNSKKPIAIFTHDNEIGKGLIDDKGTIDKYFPGKYTIIGKAKTEFLPNIVSDGKIGVRIPNNKFCMNFLKEFGSILAVTSANIADNPYNPDKDFITKTFENLVDFMVYDESMSKNTKPSIVIDVTNGRVIRGAGRAF